MNGTFHIVAERRAVRCDVCRQTDAFDMVTGRCGRCGDVAFYLAAPEPVAPAPMMPGDGWVRRRLERQIAWVFPVALLLFLAGIVAAVSLFDLGEVYPEISLMFAIIFSFLFFTVLAISLLSAVLATGRFILLHLPDVNRFFQRLGESVGIPAR
jgi:hypothetical protein